MIDFILGIIESFPTISGDYHVLYLLSMLLTVILIFLCFKRFFKDFKDINYYVAFCDFAICFFPCLFPSLFAEKFFETKFVNENVVFSTIYFLTIMLVVSFPILNNQLMQTKDSVYKNSRLFIKGINFIYYFLLEFLFIALALYVSEKSLFTLGTYFKFLFCLFSMCMTIIDYLWYENDKFILNILKIIRWILCFLKDCIDRVISLF